MKPLAERLLVNTNTTQVAATLALQGIARALAYPVTDEVRDGRLTLLLTAHEPPPVPMHLVFLAGSTAATEVRPVVECAEARLRQVKVLRGSGLEGSRKGRPARTERRVEMT